MDQAVSIKGVRKLGGGLEGKAAAQEHDASEGKLPLDGQSALVSYLDRETLLIAGVGHAFTNGLPAILNDDPKNTVPCTLVTLPAGHRSAARKRPFVALLSLPRKTISDLTRVTIRSQGHSFPFTLKSGPLDFSVFLEQVEEATTHSGSDIVDCLVEALVTPGAGSQAMQIAARIVQAVAVRDGFIEVVGRFDEGEVFVQGWAKELPAGSSRIFVFDGALKVAGLNCGLFERKDTGGKAYGFCGLVEAEDRVDAEKVRNIYLRGRTGWKALEAHERRSLTGAHALPGHIRAMLPKLSPAGDGRTHLLAAAQRFDGRETVSELDVPVRVAVDFCAEIDGSGVLLSGWLLNPEDRVKAVYLRSSGTGYRLDTTWTSQPRPDVSTAFAELSPFLNAPGAGHRHGFIVFVPGGRASGEQAAYLEIVLDSGRSTYAPVTVGRAPLRAALKRLVSGLDNSTAFQSDILERQFLPMLQAAENLEPFLEECVDIGAAVPEAEQSIVVGLDGDFESARVLLTLFAVDPFLKGTPLVLAAPKAILADRLEELGRLADFYGLSVRAVLAANVNDRLDALQAGAAAAPSETVVCFSGSVLPSGPGWLAPLIAAFKEREESCLVAPTVLYEDGTIRWAGAWIDQERGRPVLKQHYLGYPRRTLLGAESSQVAAAPFDCCVLPKTALAAAGGFSRTYLGTDEKGMDLALRLVRSGLRAYWVPEVEVIHPEDGAADDRTWQALVSSLDRKNFDRVWSPLLGSLSEDSA